jgi:hypothetical protein
MVPCGREAPSRATGSVLGTTILGGTAMNFSKLSSNDKLAVGSGAIVVITALLSLSNDWGLLMALSLLAGLAVIAVVLQPQLAPTMSMPVTRGMALLGLGAIATIATALTAVNWLGWIFDHIASFDTIQFVIGLIAAVVMLWAGYVAYQGERGTMAPAAGGGAAGAGTGGGTDMGAGPGTGATGA